MPNQPQVLDDPELRHHQPTVYLPEPTYGDSQDPDALDDVRVLSLLTTPHVAGRTGLQACEWARGESEHPTMDLQSMCGKFTRLALDIPPRDASAIAMWWGADPDARHPMANADDGDPGHPFVWKGGNFGHIGLLSWPFPTGNRAAWETDLVRLGKVDKVDRQAAEVQWGKIPLGQLDELNGYDLKTGKPKDSKPYKSLQRAIDNKEHALETARGEHDHHDIRVLKASIARDKALYAKLRHQ